MKKFLLWSSLLWIISACASPTATLPPPTPLPPTPTASPLAPPEPLTGDWLGGATKPDSTSVSLSVNFDNAKLNIEPLTKTWSMTVTQSGETVTFSVAGKSNDPFKQIEFTGTFVNGVFAGELNWDGATNAIKFTPIAVVDKNVLEKYEGVYRFESGRALSIIVSPQFTSGDLTFFSQTLMLTDFDSSALRSLYPVSDANFLVSVLRNVGAPFDGQFEFVSDAQGKVSGLNWWENLRGDTQPEFAKRVDYTMEEHVEFTSKDGTKLAGRLSIPNSDVPVPAFMMLHGSEPGTRDNFGSKLIAHYMISRGFAILNYDKRGVGDSEGTYQEAPSPANVQRHADDAIAGVAYLAGRPEIDAKRIGLIGFSQAGWVIPLAASQSDAITHVVILSGPIVSTAHENRFSNYTNDGDSITNFDDAKITQQLRDLRPGGFDPIPIIAELDQPGLWLWGGVDKSVPVTLSAENLQAMIDSGKSNFLYQIFPNADHGLGVSEHGLFSEIPYSPGPVFYPALTQWLETNMSKGQ
jgi:dienelactone hydrolase